MEVEAECPPPMGNDAGDPEQERRIVQLEEDVINKIAAGEVVVRPANALKELLENSLDAGSANIAVAAKGGGMKMLRIEDDGHGIRTEDLPILCERFTTSKLRKYEDLNSIGTFGFRGEALASISHVAHVTVTTMTKGATCAHMSQYSEGKLRGSPRPCAGTRGTTLVFEDLFYNNPTRRAALGKDHTEHARLLEVVQKYAIHYPSVSMSCKRIEKSLSEVQTPGGNATSAADVVGLIYGQALAKELFPFDVSSEDQPRFRCKGLASNPNWTSRTCAMTLFINHRLVECVALRRAVEAAYAPILPRHQHPWIYLAIELPAETIDVNVHPTKMEVQFLDEDLIAEKLQDALAAQLRELGGTRSFNVRPIFPAAKPSIDEGGEGAVVQMQPVVTISTAFEEKKKVELNPTRVRTDPTQRNLDSIWRESGSQREPARPLNRTPSQPMDLDSDEAPAATQTPADPVAAQTWAEDKMDEDEAAVQVVFDEVQSLTSIQELKATVNEAGDQKLTARIQQSVYVGAVDRELVAVQCGKSLSLLNLVVLARECAYQRLLQSFGAVPRLVLSEPLPLEAVLRLGILDPGSGYSSEAHPDLDVAELARKLAALLEEKAEMLEEYAALDVRQGVLRALPNPLKASSAALIFDALPLLLVRLCCEVEWSDEKLCFESLCRLLADFSVEALLPSEEAAANAYREVSKRPSAVGLAEAVNAAVASGEFEDVGDAAAAAKRARVAGPRALEELRWLHETVRLDRDCLFPAEFGRDTSVLDLVSLDQLYRIFERC